MKTSTTVTVNESASLMNGLLGHKRIESAPTIPKNDSKWTAVMAGPITQNITSKDLSKLSEPIPGTSRQTENRQEALQRWLEEVYSRLLYLAKNEPSIPFAALVSSLKGKQSQPEASEKNTLEFLLALDDFFQKNLAYCYPLNFILKNYSKIFVHQLMIIVINSPK